MSSIKQSPGDFLSPLLFACWAWLLAAAIAAVAAKHLVMRQPPATLFHLYYPSWYDERPEKIFFFSFFFLAPLFSWFGTRFYLGRFRLPPAMFALVGFAFLATEVMRATLGISSAPDWPALAHPIQGKHAGWWLIAAALWLFCSGRYLGLTRSKP